MIPKFKNVRDELEIKEPHDVVSLAKVDVTTYTQRLINDLKKHEEEFRKKEMESFGKNAILEAKDPFNVEYKVTKGALESDLIPDERTLLSNKQEDIMKWQ